MGLSSSKAAAGRRLRQAAGRAESNYTTYEDDIYKCDEASLYGPSNQTTLDACRAEAELYAGEVAAYQFFVGQTAPECYLYTPSCFSAYLALALAPLVALLVGVLLGRSRLGRRAAQTTSEPAGVELDDD
jgi:putative component of membrane protein insertase Oxa1/YidC/SpoIIIJ protein YidD